MGFLSVSILAGRSVYFQSPRLHLDIRIITSSEAAFLAINRDNRIAPKRRAVQMAADHDVLVGCYDTTEGHPLLQWVDVDRLSDSPVNVQPGGGSERRNKDACDSKESAFLENIGGIV